MRITIGTQTIEGTTKEICEFFGITDARALPQAIEKYKQQLASTPSPSNHRVSQPLVSKEPRIFMETNESNSRV